MVTEYKEIILMIGGSYAVLKLFSLTKVHSEMYLHEEEYAIIAKPCSNHVGSTQKKVLYLIINIFLKR